MKLDQSSTCLLTSRLYEILLAMSLFQTVNTIKDEALNSVVCPIVIRLGIQAIPAASLLVGEVTFSYFLHYGVILPSPIGIELMEFPARMIYILERKKMRAMLPKLWLLLSPKNK